MLHSSESRFSIGVPVKAKRWSAATALDRFGNFGGVVLDVLGLIQMP